MLNRDDVELALSSVQIFLHLLDLYPFEVFLFLLLNISLEVNYAPLELVTFDLQL